MLLILSISAIVLFLLIFFISRSIFNLLYTLVYLPTHHLPASVFGRRQVQAGQTLSKTIVTMLFIPGTAIHEFSHAIVARVLGAEVGDIMLYPHKDKETGEFKAGSCEIEKVDPVRLAIIGVAPTLIGLLLLILIVYYMFSFSPPINDPIQALSSLSILSNYFLFLALFMISATMFTSKKDVQELFLVIPAIVIMVILFYYVGFRFTLTESMTGFLIKILRPLVFVLGITTLVDLLVYLLLFLPTTIILKIFGMKFK
ncbi:hypothetical protein HYT02_04185 [Candidatus Gottesmanbacteria bacterium]|nr:hypothetical protein [Candidatus Gottesmanbacteria bacterium]